MYSQKVRWEGKRVTDIDYLRICSGDNCWFGNAHLIRTKNLKDILKMCICHETCLFEKFIRQQFSALRSWCVKKGICVSSCEVSITLNQTWEVSAGLITIANSQMSFKPSQRFSSCSMDIDERAFGAQAIRDPVAFLSSLNREGRRRRRSW
jgi:hypothetical protein